MKHWDKYSFLYEIQIQYILVFTWQPQGWLSWWPAYVGLLEVLLLLAQRVQILGSSPIPWQQGQSVTLPIKLCGHFNLNVMWFSHLFHNYSFDFSPQLFQNAKKNKAKHFQLTGCTETGSGQVWPVVSSLLGPGLDHSWFIPCRQTYCYANKKLGCC